MPFLRLLALCVVLLPAGRTAGGFVPCDADLDDTGEVTIADLLLLIVEWGACPGCPQDFNGDDLVTLDDLLVVLGSWGPCPAPPAVVNGYALREVLTLANERRIDIVLSGDSNSAYAPVDGGGPWGWEASLTQALREHFTMYATPMTTDTHRGRGGGKAAGLDHRTTTVFFDGPKAQRTGAPNALAQYASPWSGTDDASAFPHHSYMYAPEDVATAVTAQLLGATLRSANPGIIGLRDELRHHLVIGRFAEPGPGRLNYQIRNSDNGAVLFADDLATEGYGETALAIITTDLPADPLRFGPIQARVQGLTPPESTAWRGRSFTLYHRWENLERQHGFSLHLWGNHPGRGTRWLLGILLGREEFPDASAAYKTYYLEQVVRLQTDTPRVIFWIAHAGNDIDEAGLPSLGPGGPLDSATKAGVRDNFRGLHRALLTEAEQAGIDAEQCHFVFQGFHRKPESGNEARLATFRLALAELAEELPRTTAINPAALFTLEQMTGYYEAGGTVPAHLTVPGYNAVAGAIVEAIMASQPPGVPEAAPGNSTLPTTGTTSDLDGGSGG